MANSTGKNGNDWTEETRAEFERLYALAGSQHMSLSEIAASITRKTGRFMSRNAATGLAHRMNLHLKYPRSKVGLGTAKAKTRKAYPIRRSGNNPFGAAGTNKVKMPKPVKTDCPVMNVVDESKAIRALDAPESACQWPMGERDGFMFICGCPRYSPSLARPNFYCVAHSKASSGGLPVPNKKADAYQPKYRRGHR
jgi:hypothetical protein